MCRWTSPTAAVLAELLTERTGRTHRDRSLRSAAKSVRWSTWSARTRSSPTTSASACCSPRIKAIQEALQDALTLEELPRRIECFDISHIQGAETVASMVVWEDGAMKKADYRKFQVKTVTGVDDFATMREVIQRRYKRLLEDKKPFPSLILIDGGLGQLHAAAAALEEIGDPDCSRSPPSPSAKRSSTSTGRRTTRSCSTAARRCCT